MNTNTTTKENAMKIEIMKEEIEAIYEEICTECDNGDG